MPRVSNTRVFRESACPPLRSGTAVKSPCIQPLFMEACWSFSSAVVQFVLAVRSVGVNIAPSRPVSPIGRCRRCSDTSNPELVDMLAVPNFEKSKTGSASLFSLMTICVEFVLAKMLGDVHLAH